MTKLEQFIQRLEEHVELRENNYGTLTRITREELRVVWQLISLINLSLENWEHTAKEGSQEKHQYAELRYELSRLAAGVLEGERD